MKRLPARAVAALLCAALLSGCVFAYLVIELVPGGDEHGCGVSRLKEQVAEFGILRNGLGITKHADAVTLSDDSAHSVWAFPQLVCGEEEAGIK